MWLTVVSLVFCFPVGLVLTWLMPWTQRTKWIITGVIAALVVVGIIGTAASPHSTTNNTAAVGSPSVATRSPSPTTAKSSPSPANKPTPAPPATIPPINLSGSGQQATQQFTVTSGLAIFTASCGCSGNFAIELLDSGGQLKDVAVNVIGSYSGSVGEGLGAGSYSLKIDADADWTVTITQPRHLSGASLPHTYTGTGQQTVGPVNGAGGSAIRLQAQNTGSGSNFSVEVLDSDGNLQDVAFNQIGNFSGSTVSNSLSNGPFWLKVDSDGTWTIAASNP